MYPYTPFNQPMYTPGMPQYNMPNMQPYYSTNAQQAPQQAQAVYFINDPSEISGYSLRRGTAVMFVDIKSQHFYVKAVDYNGVEMQEQYEFRKVSTDAEETDVSNDIAQLKQQVDALRTEIRNGNAKQSQPIAANATGAAGTSASSAANAANAAGTGPAVTANVAASDGWPAGA